MFFVVGIDATAAMPSTAAGGREIGTACTPSAIKSSAVPVVPLTPLPLDNAASVVAEVVFSEVAVASPAVGFRIFCTSLRNHSAEDDRDAAAVDINRVDFPPVVAAVDVGSAGFGASFSFLPPLFLDFFAVALVTEPVLLPGPVLAVEAA